MLLFAKMLHASMTLGQCNDGQKFGTDAISFREIQCKKMDILMFKETKSATVNIFQKLLFSF